MAHTCTHTTILVSVLHLPGLVGNHPTLSLSKSVNECVHMSGFAEWSNSVLQNADQVYYEWA